MKNFAAHSVSSNIEHFRIIKLWPKSREKVFVIAPYVTSSALASCSDPLEFKKQKKSTLKIDKAKIELKLPESRHARDIDQRMTRECCGYDESPPSIPATIFHDRIFQSFRIHAATHYGL